MSDNKLVVALEIVVLPSLRDIPPIDLYMLVPLKTKTLLNVIQRHGFLVDVKPL